jgi:hypothetical protein
VLQGATADAHQVAVRLNGVELGTVSWVGLASVTQELSVPAGLLVDGANAVVLTLASGSGVAVVDRLAIRYARPYRAVADQLEAVAPSGSRVVLTGFNRPDVRAFDVTDANAPIELATLPSSAADGYAVTIESPDGGSPRIVRAQSSAIVNRPDAVTANVPSSICGTGGAEIAVIAPRAFFPALAPWVAARTAAGWSVELDDIEDVFDEMTYGAHHAAAVTAFVRLRRTGATPRTRYLLLAGGASLDPRNFLGKNVPDLVPTALIDTDAIETASDEAMADLDGDGVAELAVGRWPARDADALSALVDATLALDGHGPFDRGALVVTGTSGEASFRTSADEFAAVLPVAADRYDPSGLSSDEARADLVARWSSGPSFVQYFGHGSEQVWEGLLSTDTVGALGAPGRRAVVSAMTCLNGMFQDVYRDCLAEQLLSAPGGAVAVWASADLYDAGAQSALASAFASNANTMALGAAAHGARLATGGAGRAMIFFGDPTLFGSPSPTGGQSDPDAGTSVGVTGSRVGPAPVVSPTDPGPPSSRGESQASGCAIGGRNSAWPLLVAVVAASMGVRLRRRIDRRPSASRNERSQSR